MSTLIVLSIIILSIAFAVKKIKKGESCCSGGCKGCSKSCSQITK